MVQISLQKAGKRFNKDWIENPDIYKNEITISHQNVKPIHSLNFNWDYY